MALLNNMYIWIEKEDIAHKMNVTSNPTESGIDLTDHAERDPLELSLSGMLLDDDINTAYTQYTKLRNWQLACKQVKYVGRNIFTGIITDISKSNDYTVENGAPISMTLKEIRIAHSPYQTGSTKNVIQKQVVTKKAVTAVYHIVKKGENLTLIAKKYGTTVNNILKLNTNIKNANQIYVNQKIRIK